MARFLKPLIVIVLAAMLIFGLTAISVAIFRFAHPQKKFLGAIIWLVLGILSLGSAAVPIAFGFRSVAEEERWIIEVFGGYYRTLGPGLRWLCPYVEKARALISVWVQRYPLFEGERTSIDFRDGSAKPKDAFVYIQCREVVDETVPQIDPDTDPSAPYRMVYGATDLKGATVGLMENAVRSYLNGLTVNEGITAGHSGYNILERIPKPKRDGIRKQLEAWGIRVLRVTIGDFDLDPAIIEARESVTRAARAAEAATYGIQQRSREAVGVIIQMLADSQRLTVEQVQAQLLADPALHKEVMDSALDFVRRKIAIDGRSFTQIDLGGGGDLEKGLAKLIVLLKGGAAASSAPASGGAAAGPRS